tara:strand:+ start:1891 stop:2124 length:234 start_codon:yes stop_codon:yes gene_type:complete
MTTYRVQVRMGGQYFDDKVTAENDKEALDKFVKLVDENKANVIDDEKFFSTDKIYVTYEVLKDESTEDRTVEKTSTP